MYACIYLLNLRMLLGSPNANDLYIIFLGLEFPLFFVHVARALNLFYLVKWEATTTGQRRLQR